MSTRTRFNPEADEPCYEPRMTRADALARRLAGTLRENCVVVITDGPAIGTDPSATEIELNPTSPTELGHTARIHTAYDDSAWSGIYDIDLGTGTIQELHDNLGNHWKDSGDGSTIVAYQFYGDPQITDNYFEDSTFTALPYSGTGVVRNNKFIDTTMDSTGISGNSSMQQCHIEGTGTHRRTGPIANWTRVTVRNSTLNLQQSLSGSVLTDVEVLDGASVTHNNPSNFTATDTRFWSNAIYNNQGSANTATFTAAVMKESAQINIDAGTAKPFSLLNSTLGGAAILHLQNAGGSFSISTSEVYGAGFGVDEINHIGSQQVFITNSNIRLDANTWTIDGTGNVNIARSEIDSWNFTKGPAAAGTTSASGSFISSGALIHNGDGNVNVDNTRLVQSTINSAAGYTGDMSLSQLRAYQGTVECLSGARTLEVIRSEMHEFSRVTQTSTLEAPNIRPGDTVDSCFLGYNGVIEFASTHAAPGDGNVVTRTDIRGATVSGLEGIVRFQGLTDQARVDGCTVLGRAILTDVPAGALSFGSDFHDNHIDSESAINYTGGDGVRKQIRNIHVSGQSILNLIGLTGSAGAVLGDVFSGHIEGQSVVNVTGARVVGQPVRNFRVSNNSVLNVDPSGTVLQWVQQNGAVVNTGAFRHSEVEISGPFVKTLTAPNVNRLANKSFDDTI